MSWCINEALKARAQVALGQTKAISLFRDERNGRIAVRFRAVGSDLQEYGATLGQERDAGTGANNLTLATQHIMTRTVVGKAFVKTALLKHLKRTVVGLAVDSAADEVLSGEMMKSSSLASMPQTLTCNLRFVMRDKAHAARRILSRPWAADAFLKDVSNMFVRGRASMARLIQCSHEVRRVFKRFVKQCCARSRRHITSNLRAAGHTFESFQKPLSRTCIHLHSCIRTALHFAHRQDNTGARARTWLLWLDTEKCLMLGMMADASGQVLLLVRILDNENVDPAVVNREVHVFVTTIQALFGDSRKCLAASGYTQIILRELKKPMVWFVRQTSCSIGCADGVSQDIIDRCLSRMKSWVILAAAVVAAEFPSFEICQAFSVMDVGRPSPPTDAHVRLKQIARVCDLKPMELIAQWEDLYPRAQSFATSEHRHANKSAWRMAIEDSRGPSNRPTHERAGYICGSRYKRLCG